MIMLFWKKNCIVEFCITNHKKNKKKNNKKVDKVDFDFIDLPSV